MFTVERYFVLDGNQMRYYRKRGDPAPRGTYVLTDGCLVSSVFNSEEKHKHHGTFARAFFRTPRLHACLCVVLHAILLVAPLPAGILLVCLFAACLCLACMLFAAWLGIFVVC